ncbi:MAG TPA: MFS transporter [Ktedonosporobacter sp.]|nr:MFS transporter [Ktedonosporobacter sp.]
MIWIGGTIARLSEALLLSGFGYWILSSIAKDPTSGAALIRGITMVGFVALFLLGPIAGVFVDRWTNPKRVILVTTLLRAGCALVPIAIAFLLASHRTPAMASITLATIYVATFLISTLTHFAIPASYILFADNVKEEDYSYANGVLLTTSFLALMIGAPIGLLTYSFVGLQGVLLLDAVLYIVSFVATTYISFDPAEYPRQAPRTGLFHDFKEGIAFCFKNSHLAILLLTLALVNIWNGAETVLGPAFVTQNLHMAYTPSPIQAPEGSYDALGLTVGAAFALGSLLFGLISRRLGEKRIFAYSLVLMGIFALVLSRTSLVIPGFALIFVISLLTMGVNVTAVPVYLWVTPRHMLGRVRAIVDFTTNIAPLVVGGLSLWLFNGALKGFHGQVMGITFTSIDTIFIVAAVICLVGGIIIVRRFATDSKAMSTAINQGAPADEPEMANAARLQEPTMSGRV